MSITDDARTHPPEQGALSPLQAARRRTAAAVRKRFAQSHPRAEILVVTEPWQLHQALVEDLVEVYARCFSQEPYLEGEADFAAFRERLLRHAQAPGFHLAAALLPGPVRPARRAVAFGYGRYLLPGDDWWTHLTPDPDTEFDTAETGSRTFLGQELAVVPDYQSGIVGPATYDAAARQEAERITLAARPDAAPAYRMYLSLGYRRVGRLEFAEGQDAPAATYDALVLDGHPATADRADTAAAS